MNNIRIARETIQITKKRSYSLEGKEILLPDCEYSDVSVYTPEQGAQLLASHENMEKEVCKVVLTTEDSYQAAKRYSNALVMNFANAHVPGGGFLFGATAQEESLCRCSTLYESISSKKAAEMYNYNRIHRSKVASDYMLLSRVCVFRDHHGSLLENPYMAGVVTIAAPNRGGAAMFASREEIRTTILRRIRIMLVIAKNNGYKNLVLGAWGCGAFRNDPDMVAACFKQVLVEEGYGKNFDEVCFAIYGNEKGKNYRAFKKQLANC